MSTVVKEIIDGIPLEDAVLAVERDEALLLKRPDPQPLNLWAKDAEPLKAVHFPQNYIDSGFAVPRDVYGGDHLRLEWQQMNNRQPFYHRNADVEEISFQVAGQRTLSTELGVVELTPGDFSRIPVGVAHDNYGRDDVHILFYVHGPISEIPSAHRQSKAILPPFEGWKSQVVTELMTECLGTPDCSLTVSLADETMLLSRALREPETPINVLRPEGVEGETVWAYCTPDVWIGYVLLKDAKRTTYHRHRRAIEIQYQVKGTRTVTSQQGSIDLQPGDFVSIPKGCSFASATSGESVHISVLSSHDTPLRANATKVASLTVW